MNKLSAFEKQLMLDEITFYSICSNEDKEKILEMREMSFDDFQRLSLIASYLQLEHLHQFIWDTHAYKFAEKIGDICCGPDKSDADLSKTVLTTGRWLDDFWKNAPNDTVAYLLHEIFSNGLEKKDLN